MWSTHSNARPLLSQSPAFLFPNARKCGRVPDARPCAWRGLPPVATLAEPALRRMHAVVGRCEDFLHSSEPPDRGSPSVGQRRGRSLPESHPPGSDRQALPVKDGDLRTTTQVTAVALGGGPPKREVLWKMTKEEALDLQATVNGILAQAAGERSRIGGAVNWADLRCVDVEISLLDGHVTVTIEEASPEAIDLCRYVAKELARRGYDGVAVRTEW
jgi:hypothetical protein